MYILPAKELNSVDVLLNYVHNDRVQKFLLITVPLLQPKIDEEQMGDIISLVDSVQEDYLPPIPMKYKTMTDEPLSRKLVRLH